ncbi:MAG: DUF1674 domain-containing protein [Gammaproteobacteria bacterium]|nr:DUF1674 domain-containing protein [Gammaproteobacteria bacterium]NBT44286.1 DUF1674 domain-containing protein [Gammaproteobacteria bacterium]NBY21753.1 DUF1674 domain-containing protein [Gammaproteobacteria bacterium]NDE34567.1 DUF1674 domain-containing protein [Gammaproteobacteria bacterium]NDE56520.1 DUF1674 domain-containing protein [Gammaproteobacteria bacterium]
MPSPPENTDQKPLMDPAPRPSGEDLKSLLPNDIGLPSDSLDPTRFGDWEKKGRCIDF